MSDAVLVALVGAGAAILTGLLALIGQRWNQRSQEKLSDNADRLRRFEEWEHLLDNHRQDLEACRGEVVRLRGELAEALRRARTAERQVDQWLEQIDRPDGR